MLALLKGFTFFQMFKKSMSSKCYKMQAHYTHLV